MIFRPEQLAALLPRLHSAEWLALDTEADSLHAYPEKLCLIQISLPGEDVLIDPLAAMPLTPFWELFRQREWIMHGADYDLRLLHRRTKLAPRAVFDTMIAARLLGNERFGLQDLAARHLGVQLEKGPQKSNWALRPLSERLAEYARNDTRHLKHLADLLRAELEQKGRLEWLRESCVRLIQECIAPRPDGSDDDWRVKGASKLKRPALAILRELWRWREHEAIANNKPPYFILSHEKLVEIAEAASRSQAWEPLLPRTFSPRRHEGVEQAVRRGQTVSPEEQPAIHRSVARHPSAAELRRFDQFKHQRDMKAKALGIDPTLIASRATLEALARDGDAAAGALMNWQRGLLLA